jgi:hypothetical protein
VQVSRSIQYSSGTGCAALAASLASDLTAPLPEQGQNFLDLKTRIC